MGLEHTTPSCVVSIFMVVFFYCMVGRVFGDLSSPQVPCYFIFGDSLVESGNNNKLPTIARANVPPYGVDFPGGATGRFTNGRTTADVLAQLLGFSTFIQPYANLSEQPSVSIREQTILRGLNYASAAGGIRNETGQHLGPQTSLDDQLKNHKSLLQEIFKMFGPKEVISAWKYINKCLYTVGMGSNDYLNNYFMPQYYTTNQQYTPEKYSQVLFQQYSRQIKRLYDNGAKKIALWGVGPIGCTPFELVGSAANGRPPCVNDINAAVQLLNNRIKLLADNLNNEFGSDVRVTYINVYDITLDILTNPSSYGFKIANEACCGVEKNSTQISCIPLGTPCSNRTEYVFWDAFNPTEAANIIIAGRAYIARTPTDAYPWDIKTLLQQKTDNSLIS